MAVAVTLELKCQSGKGGELVGVLKSMLGDTRARQGAKSIEMVVKQDNSDHIMICPSSKHLGHVILFPMGGSGSSRFDVMPLVVDGLSGGFG